ncbi:MAG: RNA-binding protein [Alphaproteobacteria bacterium]|nr:RNA-binding protein [Alphaproteobacteria bacterium]
MNAEPANADEAPLPDRMCIVSREVKPETALIRFARAPDGLVVPDLKRKLPGRGVWVTCDAEILAEAIKRKAFSRGFGAEAKVGPELVGQVATLLRKDMLAALSLTRRAGLGVCGFMKVEEALVKGNIRVLLHASDGSIDGRQKLDRKCASNTVIWDLFSSSDLDLAFGRSNVIHAAVANGGLAEKLLDYAQKIAQYEHLKVSGLGFQTVA